MTKELAKMDYVELTDHITEAVGELKRKAYGEGYRQGRMDAIPEPAVKARKLTRAEVVRKAKADIDGLKNGSEHYAVPDGDSKPFVAKAEFIVNNNKRTVVVLMRGWLTGIVRSKGIAKCAPGDCFNEAIGKAIALRRALNLEVPSEYTNAPKPEGIEVGDVLYVKYWDGPTRTVNINGGYGFIMNVFAEEYIEKGYAELIDDSARNY